MSDNKNSRQLLVEYLTPLLPRGWRLVPYQTSLDVISQPTVMLKLQTVRRSPEAPMGVLTAEYIITVIEPKQDASTGEAALDDKLFDLMYALRNIPGVLCKEATSVVFGNTNLAFDISIEVLTTAPTNPTP